MRNAPNSISGKTLDDTRFEARLKRMWAKVNQDQRIYRCVECARQASYYEYHANDRECIECGGRLDLILPNENIDYDYGEELPY